MSHTDPRAPIPPAESCPQERPDSSTRRRFLSWLSGGLGALVALLASIPLIGFLFSPALKREAVLWRSVGDAARFPVGETVMVTYLDPEPLPWAGFAGRSSAWLRRESEDSFLAFSMYCTHAGCPVTWTPGADLFMCPCHGGVFHRDGSVAAGPPRQPLERLPVRVRNGLVEVQTSHAPLRG